MVKYVRVAISSLEHRRPIYHDPKISCGQVNWYDTVAMPLRHAEKFARPCLNCYRELRR